MHFSGYLNLEINVNKQKYIVQLKININAVKAISCSSHYFIYKGFPLRTPQHTTMK